MLPQHPHPPFGDIQLHALIEGAQIQAGSVEHPGVGELGAGIPHYTFPTKDAMSYQPPDLLLALKASS